MLFSTVLLLCLAVSGSLAAYGSDVSQLTSVGAFQCMKSIVWNSKNLNHI